MSHESGRRRSRLLDVRPENGWLAAGPARRGTGRDPPDGTWAVALLHKLTDPQLMLYPTAAGQPRPLTFSGFVPGARRFSPDGRRFICGRYAERWYPDLPGSAGRTRSGSTWPLTPEKVSVVV